MIFRTSEVKKSAFQRASGGSAEIRKQLPALMADICSTFGSGVAALHLEVAEALESAVANTRIVADTLKSAVANAR